jgi:hypothetical protein
VRGVGRNIVGDDGIDFAVAGGPQCQLTSGEDYLRSVELTRKRKAVGSRGSRSEVRSKIVSKPWRQRPARAGSVTTPPI